MIGDWVYRPDCYSRVKEIRENGIIGLDPFRGIIGFKELEPIPLTTEILEKNGFEKVLDEDGTECYRYYNSAGDGYIKISLYNGGDGDWSIEIINYEKFDNNEIVYNNNFIFLKVHQLQHALKICGIDKEIEL